MKRFILIAIVTLLMACAPSDEAQLSRINVELEEQTIAEYCQLSVGTLHGEKVYIVDTPIIFRDDNFADCITVYCTILGCAARAIESDEGYLRVATESLYLDMTMAGVHECLAAADDTDELIDTLDRHIEWVDR